jgi:hypothetical protein
MWWRRRKARKPEATRPGGWPHGRHRLADGDTVPVNGERWMDYLRTEEIPIISTVDRPLMTRLQELRAPDPRRAQ